MVKKKQQQMIGIRPLRTKKTWIGLVFLQFVKCNFDAGAFNNCTLLSFHPFPHLLVVPIFNAVSEPGRFVAHVRCQLLLLRDANKNKLIKVKKNGDCFSSSTGKTGAHSRDEQMVSHFRPKCRLCRAHAHKITLREV